MSKWRMRVAPLSISTMFGLEERNARWKMYVIAFILVVGSEIHGTLAWSFPKTLIRTPSLQTTAQQFVDDWNDGKIANALSSFDENCVFDFATFRSPCSGVESLERRLRLMKESYDYENQIIKIDECISDERATAIKFHVEDKTDGNCVPFGRGSAFFVANNDGLIENVFWVQETEDKAGASGLKILKRASSIVKAFPNLNPAENASVSYIMTEAEKTSLKTAPQKYFAAWNRRDMEAVTDLFENDVTYDDTAFPEPFVGKEALKQHVLLCAECFPSTFSFEVDDIVDGQSAVCAKWHVENNGQELPFTRGCSFYKISKARKIEDGIDFLEPTGFQKKGGVEMFSKSFKGKIAAEPVRLVPLVVWSAYVVIVFFSDGILPGANALALEQRTWEEVRDLSLNFFFVSPLLNLPFSPVVHPMLEGVFNVLLSWAAMFAGFLSDDRKDKPNLFGMLPIVVGMQFLTSAFLLPYLATRSTEQRTNVSTEELSFVAKACESPLLGALMGGVGTLSIGWAFLGRFPEYGGLVERWHSFIELMSIDRVGSSFLVDLVIFGLFQFWLVDDDMKRRGVETGDSGTLVAIAKFIPFFGMAAYLCLRPSFRSDSGSP